MKEIKKYKVLKEMVSKCFIFTNLDIGKVFYIDLYSLTKEELYFLALLIKKGVIEEVKEIEIKNG